MKAPDKIYVQRYSYGALVGGYSDKPKEMADGENITYIRKDALIEWLDGKMTIEGATEGFVGGYDTALKDVIDKINSM